MSTDTPRRPFNPWPLAIIGYFVLFISGVASFIVFACRQPMDLVRSDYYDQEVRYEDQIDRLRRTGAVGQAVDIRYQAAGQCILLQLPASHAASGKSLPGQIELYRPSDARLDRQFPLHADASGLQRIEVKGFRQGLWKIRVHWEVDGKDYFHDQSLVLEGGAS